MSKCKACGIYFNSIKKEKYCKSCDPENQRATDKLNNLLDFKIKIQNLEQIQLNNQDKIQDLGRIIAKLPQSLKMRELIKDNRQLGQRIGNMKKELWGMIK